MKKSYRFKKIGSWAITLSLAGLFALPALVGAQVTSTNDFGLSTEFGTTLATKSDRSVQEIIASVINIVLGFLGIIAVLIILAGGFKWMTAAGNEDKVGEARSMITQGLIGLVIVFAAWAIASFVIGQLKSAAEIKPTT